MGLRKGVSTWSNNKAVAERGPAERRQTAVPSRRYDSWNREDGGLRGKNNGERSTAKKATAWNALEGRSHIRHTSGIGVVANIPTVITSVPWGKCQI